MTADQLEKQLEAEVNSPNSIADTTALGAQLLIAKRLAGIAVNLDYICTELQHHRIRL